MACKPLPLEFGPLQEQILNRGQIFWDSPKQMSKQLVLAYQAPAIIYCGQRLSQGKTMKGAQLGAKCATMYNNPVAGGMLRYLVDTAGVELPRKLTLSVMGKTNIKDEGCPLYDDTKTRCWDKNVELRKELKLYTEAWESVKPEGGKIPSGMQLWDFIIRLIERLWEDKEDAADAKSKNAQKKAAKEELLQAKGAVEQAKGQSGEAIAAAAALMTRAQAVVDEGPRPRKRAECPRNWTPTFLLCWSMFGPLSKDPIRDFCIQASGSFGTAGDGDKDSKLRVLRSPDSNGEYSRRKFQELKREARKDKMKADKTSRAEAAIEKTGEQVGQLVAALTQVAGGRTSTAAADKAQASVALLKQMVQLAEEAGDVGKAEELKKKQFAILEAALDEINGGNGRDVDGGAGGHHTPRAKGPSTAVFSGIVNDGGASDGGCGEGGGGGKDSGEVLLMDEGGVPGGAQVEQMTRGLRNAGAADGGIVSNGTPRCSGHGLPATLWQSKNKKTLKGATFYVCSVKGGGDCDFMEECGSKVDFGDEDGDDGGNSSGADGGDGVACDEAGVIDMGDDSDEGELAGREGAGEKIRGSASEEANAARKMRLKLAEAMESVSDDDGDDGGEWGVGKPPSHTESSARPAEDLDWSPDMGAEHTVPASSTGAGGAGRVDGGVAAPARGAGSVGRGVSRSTEAAGPVRSGVKLPAGGGGRLDRDGGLDWSPDLGAEHTVMARSEVAGSVRGRLGQAASLVSLLDFGAEHSLMASSVGSGRAGGVGGGVPAPPRTAGRVGMAADRWSPDLGAKHPVMGTTGRAASVGIDESLPPRGDGRRGGGVPLQDKGTNYTHKGVGLQYVRPHSGVRTMALQAPGVAGSTATDLSRGHSAAARLMGHEKNRATAGALPGFSTGWI